VHIAFLYGSQSDPGPYPLSATTPIEQGSDRHAIMVNPATCTLYETWDTTYRPGGKSTAGSGAIWNLRSNALRPAGWTSADAAGLPILPGLVNRDEVATGALDHAIRFTAQCTRQAYRWPARHQAGQADANCPPMGARFRLNSGFSLPASRCSSMCQTVLRTMKTYGLILADNGSNWYFQGTADPRWTSTDVDQLKQIPASQFRAVDESCLMVSAGSGQALQAGTAAYTERGLGRCCRLLSYDVALHQSLGHAFTLSAALGYDELKGNFGYAYWNGGIAYAMGPFQLELSYFAMQPHAERLYGDAIAGDRWVGTLIWRF